MKKRPLYVDNESFILDNNERNGLSEFSGIVDRPSFQPCELMASSKLNRWLSIKLRIASLSFSKLISPPPVIPHHGCPSVSHSPSETMTMNIKTKTPRAWTGHLPVALLGFFVSASAFAQQTPTAAANEPTASNEEAITLSPFTVDTTKDEGYFAQNTLAGSRMRTNIADLASSITVVTIQQLEDTASVDINDVFRYEANTEGSGSYTPSVQSLRNDGVVDVNAGFTAGSDGQAQTNATANRVRGIGVPGSSQNYYPAISQVPFDAYNIQSIEISRGPNSMLFGMGSPAGIVNSSNAQAVLNRDSQSASFRTDDRGSFRGSFSFNKGIIDDKLALYGAVLYDNKQFERKPSYDKTNRVFGAVTFRPFAKTVIRASIEEYDNDNRRPNTLTPRDSVTEWRNAGSPTYDPTTGVITRGGQYAGALALRNSSPRMAETRAYIESLPGYNASLWNSAKTAYNGVNVFGGGALTDARSPLYTPGLSLATTSRPIYQIADGVTENFFYASADRYRTSFGTPGTPTANGPLILASDAAAYANAAWARAYDTSWSQSQFWSATNNGVGSYRYPGVTDKSIYDWENVNILQMNFGEEHNTTANIELEQEILPNLNLSAGWFRQNFDSVSNYTVSQLNVATLFVDTNVKLPDGRANPYFGLPYVEDFDPDQFYNAEVNDNYRAMLAWTPDFTDNDGWSKWLGRHQLLGLWSRNDVERTLIRKRWFESSDDQIANNTIFWALNQNPNADGSPTGWNRQRRSGHRLYYLADPGDATNGSVTGASGVNQNPYDYNGRMQYYDYSSSSWNTLGITRDYIDMDASTNRAQRQVDSTSFGLTSNLWNDRFVTTFGVRKDEYRARGTTTGAVLDGPGGNEVAPSMTNQEKWVDGVLQTDAILNRYNYWDELSGTTRTTGVVFRPFKNWNNIENRAAEGSQWNQFISSLGFSYNKSDNFNPPPAAQVDGFGNALPKPTGVGEDWGVQFSLMDNKLFARINWFKATNENERTNPGTSISRLTNNVDTTLFRNWARTIALINMGHNPVDTINFGTNLSPAEEDALEAATAKIWGLPYNYYADIGTIYATRSAEAEGVEFQLTYNPTRNWTMKFTAGQQETKYADVLKEFDAWFDERNPVWSNAKASDYLLPQYAGLATYTTDNGVPTNLTNFWSSYGYRQEIRLGDQFGNENAQLYYDSVVTPQYAIASDLEGQVSPGQRKLRWSFLSNYTFNEGRFKGFSVGGNMRWEDSAVIGYYGKANTAAGTTDLTLSDISRPIYDSANTYTDLWVSYTTKIFDDRVRLKVQLNVANVFESGDLRVVGVNYDGSPNSYRIIDPRQFTLTTKFDF